MLTTKQVLDLVSSMGRPGVAGMVEALKRQSKSAMGQLSLPHSQRSLLAEVQAMSTDRRAAGDTPRPYVHPEATVRGGASGTRGPLTAAEVAWLDRLPADPAQVSYDDARELAKMHDELSSPARPLPGRPTPERNKGDLILLRSVWEPVKELHDLRTAEAELRIAQQPLPPVPSSTLGALAAAIAAENDQLSPDEALTRANNVLTDALNARRIERQQRIEAAQARIAELRAAQARRTSSTPPPPARDREAVEIPAATW